MCASSLACAAPLVIGCAVAFVHPPSGVWLAVVAYAAFRLGMAQVLPIREAAMLNPPAVPLFFVCFRAVGYAFLACPRIRPGFSPYPDRMRSSTALGESCTPL